MKIKPAEPHHKKNQTANASLALMIFKFSRSAIHTTDFRLTKSEEFDGRSVLKEVVSDKDDPILNRETFLKIQTHFLPFSDITT